MGDYLVELDQLVLGQVVEPSRSGDDDMGSPRRVLQLRLVLLQRHTPEVAPESQLGLLEVAAQSLEVLEDLVGELASVAGDDSLVGLVALLGSGGDLVEDGDDKDGSLTHAGLGLAKDVLALQRHRDGLDLHFGRMFKAALADGAFEFLLEEELVPAGEIGPLVLLLGVLLRLLLVGALVLRHNVRHALTFK